jgi:hypothetical protein
MKKFAVELTSNRFGIVLAALNVCYFISRNFVAYAFSHGDGDKCFFVKQHVFQWMKFQCADILLYINLPALAASAVQGKLMKNLFPDLCSFTHSQFQIIFLMIFITLQWLFIGWTAQTIARAIQQKNN